VALASYYRVDRGGNFFSGDLAPPDSTTFQVRLGIPPGRRWDSQRRQRISRKRSWCALLMNMPHRNARVPSGTPAAPDGDKACCSGVSVSGTLN